MPALTRQTKITFGEMRAGGVRRVLARIIAAATRQRSTPTGGQTMSGDLTSSRGLPAKRTAREAPTGVPDCNSADAYA
jgi:hypothetical protein